MTGRLGYASYKTKTVFSMFVAPSMIEPPKKTISEKNITNESQKKTWKSSGWNLTNHPNLKGKSSSKASLP